MSSAINNICRRGKFIVMEGVDCSGKTTQCKLIQSLFHQNQLNCESIRFPDRTTPIGSLIDSYLRQQLDFDDHSIHLLFTANRWERQNQIINWLNDGNHVLCDRYTASGVAYTASKLGLDFDWCYNPEKGLLQPDLVIFLNLSQEEASKRAGYGDERYETKEFQNRVMSVYKKIQQLHPENWVEVDATGSQDEVTQRIWTLISKLIS